MTPDEEDRIIRAEEIQRYTENRCEVLEEENAELKEQNKIILEDNDTLNKWIDELNEQIEKMKNCQNCKHSFSEGIGCMQRARNVWCYNYALWELEE